MENRNSLHPIRTAAPADRLLGRVCSVGGRRYLDCGFDQLIAVSDADAARYEALLVMLARERLCDALDVELSVGEAVFSRIARAAHEAGVPVIGSCHDFEKTPDAEEMAARLCRMAALGADVCKIAVMPRKRRDVVALTAACAQADDALTQPIIAISMGEMGMSTRICAEAMGSCLSFGTAGAASAPGQMEAGALREALALVHRALAREAQEFRTN